ncbi:hypothetical protein LJ707_01225 [Mucilaginibacter sp. UR6-1]|uniref:hypothetical protein n=1 Tax=Mucilaginibacter sp. UR6-1 TaxID=1435643 RepID=UPI001E4D3068|nr:hypothetical protein [Mucilaginibacter sp. UR6-1]MCC8407532.1 hypothetical protein [Mucilaginibacter sp. UR6-1]
MGTPKKTVNKKPASKTAGDKKPSGLANNSKPQKRFVDDDDDDEFDAPLDELDYDSLGNSYDEDDDDYKY